MTTTKKKKNFIEQWIDRKIDEITDYIGELIKDSVKLIIEYFKKYKHTRKIVLAVTSTICLFFYMGYKLDKIFTFIILIIVTIFYSIFFIKAFITKIKSKHINKSYKWLNELFNNQAKVVEQGKHNITINSFIPYADVLKKKDLLENRFNRGITSINKKGNSQRTFIINFDDGKKVNFRNKYYFKDYIKQPKEELSKYRIPFLLGVDEFEKPIIADLGKLNHLLIGGDTDVGKSTLINCILQSLQYYNDNIIYGLVDHKLVELRNYNQLNNVVFINEKNFVKYLKKINDEMDKRKEKLADLDLQNIKQYNKKFPNDQMPYILYLIDEVADLRLSTKFDKKNMDDIENLMIRLLNQGRAFGVHCIFATQRPSGVQLSTDVRNGLVTKLSLRVKTRTSQDMVGIRGTEKLQIGEFYIQGEDGEKKIHKSFYCDREESWEVFNEILKVRSKKNAITF